jgi:hypothetical protein
MAALDPILFRQFPLIQKIVADETWLEGERRGCWVSADDPVVKENVCLVILRVGAEMRAAVTAVDSVLAIEELHSPDHTPHAA